VSKKQTHCHLYAVDEVLISQVDVTYSSVLLFYMMAAQWWKLAAEYFSKHIKSKWRYICCTYQYH